MKLGCSLLLAALLAFTPAQCVYCAAPAGRSEDSAPVVVGYLPGYSLSKVSAEQLRPVTDLVYFGIKAPPAGELPDTPIEADVLGKLQALKSKLGCRLLLCVGGWGRSEHFAAVCRDDRQRNRLVRNLQAYCRKNGLDGVDYDWEHPKGSAQVDSYTQLLADTKRQFRPHGLLVTVALAGWQDIGQRGYDSIDRVHLMSYDHAFPHATVAKSMADINRQLKQGCPAGRLALGVPFYGRNQAGHAKSYSALVQGQAEAADRINGYALNGRATIAAKVQLAEQQKLAGVMIWELGQDASHPRHSLLKAIGQQIEKRDPAP